MINQVISDHTAYLENKFHLEADKGNLKCSLLDIEPS